MNLSALIDPFVDDKFADGSFTSKHTEDAYRLALQRLVDDTRDKDVRDVTRENVKRTLRRWPEPSTQRARRAALVSFFDWAMEEDHCEVSPARKVKKPRVRDKGKVRLTRGEVVALLDAAAPNRRDRWAVNVMLYTGCRNAELRALRGRDFMREGWVRLLGKGGKERWVPVAVELQPVVDEILALVEPDKFILPGQRSADPPFHTRQFDSDLQVSSSALRRQVMRVADRAGIALHVHPHLLRHAYADAAVRYAGERVGQAALGHASIETTVRTYTGGVTPDEMAASMSGFGYRDAGLPVKKGKA